MTAQEAEAAYRLMLDRPVEGAIDGDERPVIDVTPEVIETPGSSGNGHDPDEDAT